MKARGLAGATSPASFDPPDPETLALVCGEMPSRSRC